MSPNRAKRFLLAVFLLVTGIWTLAFAQNQVGPTNYRLGSNDKIDIQVFQEADLSLTADISTNGTIDSPFIGDIKLSGLTLGEVEQLLDSKLRGDYLIDPRITVSIIEYRPFYVAGEVKSPGSYENQPGMTARQAIVIAGGFTDRASRRKVYLIREGDKTYKEKKVKLNEKIGAGDTITVKEGFF